ncbi:Detected protein of unknown function [Hibiscus syriacus]|uniref:Uncharacterized protein n=1 Tax=Hibiscus syriacus TaxID=106335 RepID=A0A6A2XHX2_HIBSY|nr:Detected protein of unknown function [Hibiscus syriacus]
MDVLEIILPQFLPLLIPSMDAVGQCRLQEGSMRSKVERRMQKESGKTAREIRRAKKIKKKLMTDEEKYELPELPPSVHDPELFTLEQLQAFKKIGFRNKNYPVGVRGVFGGVVQNMHLHWKFHETVQARFEQALESQKLNIKKIEQELRREGINPEDPVAMAKAPAESDQEELDRFIAEIEDAADREWAEGEEEEKEEIGRIRYLNRQEFGGRPGRFDDLRNDYSDDEVRGSRGWKYARGNKKTADSDDEYEENFADAAELNRVTAGDVSEVEIDDANDSEEVLETKRSMVQKRKQDKVGRWNNNAGVRRNTGGSYRQAMAEEDSEIESTLSDLDNAMLESDAEKDCDFRASNYSKNFKSSSDEDDGFYTMKGNKGNEKNRVEYYESDDSYADNAYGKLDRIDRGNFAGLKKNKDAEFKMITKEAGNDVLVTNFGI